MGAHVRSPVISLGSDPRKGGSMRRYIGPLVGVGLIAVGLSVTTDMPAFAQGALKPIMAFIVNDDSSPVPVRVTNVSALEAAGTPVRYGPAETGLVMPPVPEGTTVVLTHVHVTFFSQPVAKATCGGTIHAAPGHLGGVAFLFNGEQTVTGAAASQALSLPLHAGERLVVDCTFLQSDGTTPPGGLVVTLTGYSVPAVQ